MRTRDQINKDYISVAGGLLMPNDKRATLLNPRLELEVLLDIRDLLIVLTQKLQDTYGIDKS